MNATCEMELPNYMALNELVIFHNSTNETEFSQINKKFVGI